MANKESDSVIEEFMRSLRTHVQTLTTAFEHGDQPTFLRTLSEMREEIENMEEACDSTR